MISKEENILFAAEKLFAEKGFEGTSTREICTAANVNVSMISYYFGSKEKLFEKLFEYRMKESFDFATSVVERKDINPWEKINLVIERYVERVKRLRDFFLIMQREQLAPKNKRNLEAIKVSKRNFMEMYMKLINEGYESGIFKNKPEMGFIHSTVSGTMFTAMNSLPVYKEFFNGDENFETEYYDKLDKHLKKLLKHLLGYEDNV